MRELNVAAGPYGASQSRCAVLVPISRYVEPACDEGLRELERRGYAVRRLFGCSAIDMARSQMATAALDEGFEETMWIDADTAFEPDAVERLRSHGLPLACGILARKGPRAGLAVTPIAKESSLTFGEGGGLVEVLYGGTAFLLVRCEVYRTIQERLALPTCNEAFGTRIVPFFMPMIEQRGPQFFYLSEDYGFCRRARLCGYKIFADTTIRLGHVGSYAYCFEDANAELPRHRSYTLGPDEIRGE